MSYDFLKFEYNKIDNNKIEINEIKCKYNLILIQIRLNFIALIIYLMMTTIDYFNKKYYIVCKISKYMFDSISVIFIIITRGIILLLSVLIFFIISIILYYSFRKKIYEKVVNFKKYLLNKVFKN